MKFITTSQAEQDIKHAFTKYMHTLLEMLAGSLVIEMMKIATELNSPGLLNGIFQIEKGLKLTSQFYLITEKLGKSHYEYLFVYVYKKKKAFLIGNSSLWVCSLYGQPQ